MDIKEVTVVIPSMLDRAYSRLTLNVKNSQETFALFAATQIGLIYFSFNVSKEATGFLCAVWGVVILAIGILLHIGAWRSYMSYKTKVKADEEIIAHYEQVLGDPQHKFEEEYPKHPFASAGKARLMLLWAIFAMEMVVGLIVLTKPFWA